MSSMEPMDLHNIMFTIISFITSLVSTLSKVIALKVFTEHKNFVLVTLGLATDSHVITNNAITI